MLRSKDYRLAARLGLTERQIRSIALRALRAGRTFRQELRRVEQQRDTMHLLRQAAEAGYKPWAGKFRVRRYYGKWR